MFLRQNGAMEKSCFTILGLIVFIFTGCTSVEVLELQTLSIFDEAHSPEWKAEVYGGEFTSLASGALAIDFYTDASSSGLLFESISFLDLRSQRQHLAIEILLQGDDLPQSLQIMLNDGDLGDDDFDLFCSIALNDYLHESDGLQRAVVPLNDFPLEGFNWVSPPLDNLPHRGPFQWETLLGVSLYCYEDGGTFQLKSLKILPLADLSFERELVQDLQLAQEEIDLLSGESLQLTAAFNSVTPWKLSIQGKESGALYYHVGNSNQIDLQWYGQAQMGFFMEEYCIVQLSLAEDNSPILAEAEFYISGAHNPYIQVNQAGYHPMEEKGFFLKGDIPRFLGESEEFLVIQGSEVVLRGNLEEPRFDTGAGAYVSTGDFSELTGSGEFHIFIPGHGRSLDFAVYPDKYSRLLNLTMKSYYYQRCSEDLTTEFAGLWHRPACHEAPANLSEWQGLEYQILENTMDVSGGWHDAGDFGKKVVPTSIALYHLLLAYEMNPQLWNEMDLNLPGDTSIPDMLRELQGGLDWMFKMQRSDGAVYTHVVSEEFHDIDGEMPHEDHLPQFVTAPSSAAVADFAAIMAMAYRIFLPLDISYAEGCLEAALLSWNYLEEHPEMFPPGGYQDPPGLHTPGYADAEDHQERLWALMEIYLTTGDPKLADRVEQVLEQTPRIDRGNWVDPLPFGVFSLAMNEDPESRLFELSHEKLQRFANHTRSIMESNPMGIALAPSDYYWGTNYHLISYAAGLAVFSHLYPQDSMTQDIVRQVDYLCGRNPLDYSYITGVGIKSVQDPLQCASINDAVPGPVSGFLVPGPNPTRDDFYINEMPQNTAPLALYLDYHQAYSGNEVALVFNAPLVLCLSYLNSVYR